MAECILRSRCRRGHENGSGHWSNGPTGWRSGPKTRCIPRGIFNALPQSWNQFHNDYRRGPDRSTSLFGRRCASTNHRTDLVVQRGTQSGFWFAASKRMLSTSADMLRAILRDEKAEAIRRFRAATALADLVAESDSASWTDFQQHSHPIFKMRRQAIDFRRLFECLNGTAKMEVPMEFHEQSKDRSSGSARRGDTSRLQSSVDWLENRDACPRWSRDAHSTAISMEKVSHSTAP